MDSGIDSTESSNGSVEEVEEAPMNPTMQPPNTTPNNTNPANPAALSSPSSSSLSPSSSPSSSGVGLAPSSLKALAASTVNEIQTEAMENTKNTPPSHPRLHLHQAATPTNTPAHTFKLGTTEIPEGSRLQLHFPLSSKDNPEDGRGETFDLDPPPGLTFANVSPSMYLSQGFEVYSRGYAVLPYENDTLKRKLRTLRRRMRQQHYNILCANTRQRMLRISVGLNNVESVESLLQKGVDPRVKDNKDRSPLHIAASKGYADIARLLLQHGADPNQKDAIGNTALHLAACTSNIPMVTLLLKAGTDVRQADNQGYSPIHLAHSKLKLLQRDNCSSSSDIKKQVYQVIEMMQTYLERSGSAEEAELLNCFTTQLSLSDTRQDVQALLDSLNNLSLSSTTTTPTTTSPASINSTTTTTTTATATSAT